MSMSRKFVCKDCGFELGYHTDMTVHSKTVCPQCKSKNFEEVTKATKE